ncbi:MAG: Rne/Rng family ribonuclease [Planctomycetes bacterium]|nr:Rne/Rng family ribonuclease [Planctomycetota bacterium]
MGRAGDDAGAEREAPSFGDSAARTGFAEPDALPADEPDTESAEHADEAGESTLAEAPAAQRADDDAGGRERRRRRRGRRGGRRKRGERGEPATGPVAVEIIPGEDDEFQRPAGASDADELPELPDDAHLLAPEPSKRSRERHRREEDDEPERPSVPRRKNVILVNAADPEEVRVAVVEGHHVVDFQMTARRHKSYVNDIYRGKVVNLEPAIGAAFIDFGEGRNGFLHTSDVLSAYGEADWSLEKLLTTKVDPEEWDAGSSQPHIGVEMSDDELRAHEAAHAESADHSADAGEGGETSESGSTSGAADTVHAPVVVKAPAHPRESRRGHKRMRARPRLPITDLLKKGDTVVVQVTKDAIGDKGPTLTTYISIPGRYLVLMPSMSRTGVSRKIEDERERRRLKRILAQLDIPPGMGVIVRTAGTHASKADLKRDLDYLLLLWDSFGKRLTLGRGPAPLYEESDVAIRTIRDLFTPATEAVYVDDARVFERVREFTEKLMPENVERIKLHEGSKPLFHAHNVEQEFERLFARRIDLPSGGSIVFDQAEALVAIDVNSGKTRSDGFDFEDIALKTNLDAVPEIARQIKLRDLGGIIVIDFIDMQRASSRRQIERAFRDAMDSDRARSKLGRISQFGLLELTRQRLGPGLVKMIFSNCPRCRGSGRLRTPESRAQAILRRLGAALALKGFTKVEVRTQPEVVEHLKRYAHDKLKQLETAHQREIVLCSVPEQVEDSVLRYLRADGREVRPGGRRKR